MPRLPNATYLKHRQYLIWLYEHHVHVFRYLSFQAQCDLHSFFQTAHDRTDQELLVQRKRLTASDPSLPHRAGRSMAELSRVPKELPVASTPSMRGGRVFARGVVRRDVDLERLARALIELAKHLNERDDQDKVA